jgi:hypothetical protein
VTRMSDYCKAYPVKLFRTFPEWSERVGSERVASVQTEPRDADDTASSTAASLSEEDVLFLHDNFHVTEGIFVDDQVVFDAVTPEWQQFCGTVLGFQVPDYCRAEPPAADLAAVAPASTDNATSGVEQSA